MPSVQISTSLETYAVTFLLVDQEYHLLWDSFFFFFFKGPHLWHMDVSRLGVKSELQLPAYTAATATQDLSHIYDLHHSLQQRGILNPLNEARDRTCVLMDINQICFC